MLKDLGLGYTTFDEIEHEADPAAALDHGPGSQTRGSSTNLMSRRAGSLLALPVMNSGEMPKA